MTNGKQHFHVELMCCWCLNDLLKWRCSNRNRKPWSTKMRVETSNCRELSVLCREQWKRALTRHRDECLQAVSEEVCFLSKPRCCFQTYFSIWRGWIYAKWCLPTLGLVHSPRCFHLLCLVSLSVGRCMFSAICQGKCWHIADNK